MRALLGSIDGVELPTTGNRRRRLAISNAIDDPIDERSALSAKHVGIDYPELIEQLMQFGMKYVSSRMIE